MKAIWEAHVERISLPIDLRSGKPTIQDEEPPRPTDSLDELRILLERLGSFAGETLLALHSFRDADGRDKPVRPALHQPSYGARDRRRRAPAPEILVAEEAIPKLLRDNTTETLYYACLTWLVSAYEDYIRSIAWEVYQGNADHLLARSEYQLTSEKFLELGDFKRIKGELRDRAVENLIQSRPYPKMVERFEREFHVGIHHEASTVDQFAAHHLIERRNIAVHNKGRANEQYRARLDNYDRDEELLQGITKIPVDFTQLYDWIFMIEELCTHIDEEIKRRWLCSAWRIGDPAPPELQY